MERFTSNVLSFVAPVLGGSSSSRANAAGAPPPLATAFAAGFLALAVVYFPGDPLGKSWRFWKQLGSQEKSLTSSKSVRDSVTEYKKLHSQDESENGEKSEQYSFLVNAYYDLATVFYEWGWGSSFHFSFQYAFESFAESIRRHEYRLASYLLQSSLSKPIQSVLDVGCGICGPARNISRFLNIQVTGISINDYQVQRGNELNAKDETSNVKAVQGDFMNMPFTDRQFDAAYAIEATCHAPDRVKCYSEIARVIAPGGVFASYEWCLTDKYDPNNETHRKLKADIEIGTGLPDIATTRECLKAMEQAGYEILYETDLAATPHVQPWMTPLTPSWNPLTQRFQFNPVGAVITNVTIGLLEFLRLAPAGTVQTQQVLQTGGFALVKAGQEGIFTTMYLMVGRKK